MTTAAGPFVETVLAPTPIPEVAVAENGHDPTGSVRDAMYVIPALKSPVVRDIATVPTPGIARVTLDGSQPRVSR
jgi:hypothetical protein